MTTNEAAKCREEAEGVILAVLRKLADDTGLDIIDVKAISYVSSVGLGDPARRISAVRIDLCV